ncbi:uncharacterized protein LOC116262427 isoform X2 [Nymphaea colorata]|uniref:uncharacterized protein LOC116262427 isoform X2 n=1 Tax=Nymphaea colorata TaxID=210225 RepID=UPI00129EAA11|nr:uncharacterized protein LOC116262427 isoform X2 [Nymphaea colorata]
MKLVSKKALLKQTKELEAKESQRWTFSPTFLSSLEVLLKDVKATLYPKPNDYQDRSALIVFFDKLAKEKFNGAGDGIPTVEAFGSFVMDMFTSKSDLDLSVNFSCDEARCPREKQISLLRNLSKALFSLQRQQLISGVTPILRARVPILKCTERRTGIECDISVENKDGIVRSGMLRIISSIDKRFRPLCYLTRSPPIFPPFSDLLKDGVNIKALMEAAQRFQHFGSSNKESLAALFVTLLIKLWAVKSLWSLGLCASTYEGSWILKASDSERNNMNVEEFTEQSQNVARSVGKLQFEKIYNCIKATLDNITAFRKGQIDVTELKVCLFGFALPNYKVDTTRQLRGKKKFPVDEPFLMAPQGSSKRMRYQGADDNKTLPVGGLSFEASRLHKPLGKFLHASVANSPSLHCLQYGPSHDKPVGQTLCAPVTIPSRGLLHGPAHGNIHAALPLNSGSLSHAIVERGFLPCVNQRTPYQHNSHASLGNERPSSHNLSAGGLTGYGYHQTLSGGLAPANFFPPAFIPPNPHGVSSGLGSGRGRDGHHPQDAVYPSPYNFQHASVRSGVSSGHNMQSAIAANCDGAPRAASSGHRPTINNAFAAIPSDVAAILGTRVPHQSSFYQASGQR